MTALAQSLTLVLALWATLASAPGAGSAVESEERTPNRLVHESSPYLRLHAHNPVDWYPWGTEALDRARKEQKPIFLSVGYSTCYWCHVMEREVFEDPELAALMNEYFINVKVDREERPEIDEIYMTATQILTRSGGWPNSVFLTPELEPFFAGTYFPPEDRAGRPGFRRVLEALHRAWTADPARVRSDAARVAAAVRSALATRHEEATEVPSRAAAEVAIEQLGAAFDETHGGFGSAPKFPSPASLSLLWQQAVAGDAGAERMVVETLRKMGRGAIYDQLDGGFHRYTLDAAWRIPHFEKMLYDNALVGELLAVVAAATEDPELERLARGTLDFVLEWMRLPNGAFKSAIDAETDAVEGAYYIWTREEFAEAVGEEGYSLLAPLFGIDGDPNFEEHAYTLYPTRSIEEWAAERGMTTEAFASQLEPYLEALREVRGRRPFPLVDDKVLVDWNGMMIGALAQAGTRLGSDRYLRAAERAADFVLGLRDGRGVLQHTWRNGESKIPAFLDDYAFLVRGLLRLHEATGAQRWLDAAVGLTEQLEERLRAPVGGYYMSEARDDLLVQVVSAVDSSTPSGNGIALENLIELARRTGRAVYSERAKAALRVFSGDLRTHPRAVTTVAAAVLRGLPAEPPAIEPTPPTIGALARQVVRIGATFEGESSGAWRPFRVDLEVLDGWHVNANPASLGFLVPTQVVGEVRGLEYPGGESFRFEFAPEAISVYSGRIELRGEVLVETPEVSVTYQACDDRRCLPPVTESLTIR